MHVIGVDCHKAVHAAVLIDDQGQELGSWRGANTPEGWQALTAWAATQQIGIVWGIEGSGQYGHGLAQRLILEGAEVREVNPRLTAEQRRGSASRSKTDRLDALAIARVVQREQATLPVVQADDATAVLAVQVAARDALLADLTALRNQLHQHLVQLEPVRTDPWPKLTTRSGIEALTTFSILDPDALLQAHATQVQRLATRMLLALDQAETLKGEIETLSAAWTAPLQQIVGIGPLTTGMLAAHLGSRTFRSESALAMYAGVAPLEASSGTTVRHRLNRTGNRQLNAVIHRIALSQRAHSEQARTYLARKRAEGKTREEAVRCLKRLLIRFIFGAWNQCQVPSLTALEIPVSVSPLT